jgi:hypothetical protein
MLVRLVCEYYVGNGGRDLLHGGRVHAEGFLEHGAGEVCFEDLVGRDEEAGALRRERVEGDGVLFAHVELEVLQPAREEGDVALLQGGRVQDVVVADEARVHAALEHEQRLGRARVRVQREHPAHCEVEARVRDALRVDGGPRRWSHNDGCRPQVRLGNLLERHRCNNKFTSSAAIHIISWT